MKRSTECRLRRKRKRVYPEVRAAATQQLSATVQEISRTASDLARASEGLAQAIAQFQV